MKPAAAKPDDMPARPSPAKIAADDRIVMGLVSVRRNVEAQAPISRNQTCWPMRNPETTVSPQAAMLP